MLIGLALLVQYVRSRRALLARAEATLSLPRDTDPALLAPSRRRVAAALWIARVKNGVASIAVVLVAAGVLLTAFLLLEQAGVSTGYLSGQADDAGTRTEGLLVALGAWLLLGLGLGAVALGPGRAARHQRPARPQRRLGRRRVLAARRAPVRAAACSQRVVVDLVERVRRHLALTEHQPGRPVVVSAHSQGSLIAFAALHRLTDAELARVGLVTFGSQLRVIFPRAFPAYVDYTAIRVLPLRLGGASVNLYRDTDLLAGPVQSWRHDDDRAAHLGSPDLPVRGAPVGTHGTLAFGTDWRLADPVPHVDPLDRAPVELLEKHSHYWRHPDYATALRVVRLADDRSQDSSGGATSALHRRRRSAPDSSHQGGCPRSPSATLAACTPNRAAFSGRAVAVRRAPRAATPSAASTARCGVPQDLRGAGGAAARRPSMTT